ncbi:hypothetical protein GE09DRAFT_480617 [Coniochaeta sp. 2T2.1]|nr:hypothetical protein GE09DRAFT_480617 [Coniochaeta sp. 2T2.1]
MSTPQQQPAKMVRLRQSCDNCYNKKIKCSRGRPCDQCLTHGKECNYSPSARSGKPPKAAARSPRTFPTPGPEASMFNVGSVGTPTIDHHGGQAQSFHGQMGQTTFWNQHHAGTGGKYGQHRPMAMTATPSPYLMHHVSMLDLDQYLPDGHRRSSSCDSNMQMGMDSISLWQQTQDVRQVQDLNQTPLSTPTNFGMEPMCFLPKADDTHHSSMGNHIGASEFANQRHLPTPPPNSCVSLFSTVTDHLVVAQPSLPSPLHTSGGGCACFKTCSELNNSLHDTYTRLKQSSGGLDASSFNSIMELVYRAMRGCLTLLSCERCTSPIERESAISVSNIISQISRLYQQLVFRFDLPRDMVSQPFSRLLAVSEEFAEQCQYLAEDPQSGPDLVGIVTRSMEWFDHMEGLGNPLQSIEDDTIKSGNDSDMSFQY